jgi:hypothetical protein
MFKRSLISFFVFSVMFLSSCGNHSFESFEDFLECTDWECILNKIISRTGWLAEDEGLDTIPVVVYDDDSTQLKSAVYLDDKFPPIGNQGQYGTCVAWATGYNLKTALNAIEKNWKDTDLKNSANQTSPADLWFIIGKSDKGTNCGGTNFEPAMNALISKGAGNLNSVPYGKKIDCSGTSSGDVSNKLGKYRKIAHNKSLSGSGSGNEGMTLENFKGYLSQGKPILLGARLGDRFMSWNNASVISSDTYNDPGMQHAYHAMVVAGYDNSKNAFRVRNSWGADWGDNGSIWVDYDFFLKSFCFAAFVAENLPISSKAKLMPSGYDLQLAAAGDILYKNSPRERVFSYSVRNSGTKPILASQKWTVIYMYYNAFNANDNGIIYEGDRMESEIRYTMPRITGKYYLVVYADAYNAIDESDEDNNFYFIAADNGRPLEFKDGVMLNQIVPNAKAKSVQELGGNPNTYTPAEIRSLVLRNKKR